ncbi:MAG: CRISPR-associated protein Csx3 [Verrucomicrobia bacterium]|nr:CRISPR-associated protein Csx3 [Verrucomicrobiota bacterium]
MPEKFEVGEGKLFWHDDQRLHLLAMLLEMAGLRRALGLCPPEVVRLALAQPETTPHVPQPIMTIDLATLYAATEQAKLDDLPAYEAAVLAQVPPGTDVTLTGRAPVWLYLRVAHALHGRVRILSYESPVTGRIEIYNHNPR